MFISDGTECWIHQATEEQRSPRSRLQPSYPKHISIINRQRQDSKLEDIIVKPEQHTEVEIKQSERQQRKEKVTEQISSGRKH